MSVLTYGCESWRLESKAKMRINGANARMLSRITGKTAHQEASRRTQTFDIIKAIIKRKLQWLGHILRFKEDRLIKHAVRVQFENGRQQNLLQGAPETDTFEQLIKWASVRKIWKKRTARLASNTTKERTTANNTRYALRSNTNDNNNATTNTTTTTTSTTTTQTTTETKEDDEQAPTKQLPLYSIFGGPPIKKKPTKKRKAKKKKKTRKGYTQEQRVAWAHAHYTLHHGTATDAVRFLQNTAISKHTPAETAKELQMKVRSLILPKWQNAAAAAFSSDESSIANSSTDNDTTTDPTTTLTPTGSPYQPPNWIPKAKTWEHDATATSDSDSDSASASHSAVDTPATPAKPAVATMTNTTPPTPPTPTTHGHTHNTHTPLKHLNISPIQHMNEHMSPIHLECLHNTHNLTPTHKPYISILNETYLIIHNN